MQLVTIPNQILRQPAQKVDPTSKDFTSLIDEMSRIRQENNGIGIAAPQVGESLCIINFVLRGREYNVFNPYIKNKKGAADFIEGCLSIPNKLYKVKRPVSLTLHGQDRLGNPIKLKADYNDAHVITHEIDHLNGILIDQKGKFVGEAQSSSKGKLAFGEKNE